MKREQRFRRIKPGDVFEVEHDDGQIFSMYSKLDLTSALQIDRARTILSPQIIERPVEHRKRHAYGVIESLVV